MNRLVSQDPSLGMAEALSGGIPGKSIVMPFGGFMENGHLLVSQFK